MASGTRRRAGARAEVGIGGWLFADLLLALTIVAFGGMAVASDVPLTGLTSTPITKTLAKPKTDNTPKRPRGIEQTPVKFELPVNTQRLLAKDSGELQRLRTALVAKTAGLAGRQAALVLTFGCNGDSGVGELMAHEANQQLVPANKAFFAAAVSRDFINLTAKDRLRFEIYLFTR